MRFPEKVADESERGNLQLLRARFYHGAKIRLLLILSHGILLGSAFPKPCFSSSRTIYHSLSRSRKSSFIPSFVLSPQNLLTLQGTPKCCRMKNPSNKFSDFFKKQFRFTSRFSPIGGRTFTQKRSELP